jgi:hypothetical protein
MRRWFLSLVLVALVGGVASAQGPVTATGTLARAMAIGGETPGWKMTLDPPLTHQGKPLAGIDVDPKSLDVKKLDGKRVEAKGRVETRQGVERKSYPVLVLDSIREAPGKSGR